MDTISREQQKLNSELHKSDQYGNRSSAAGLASNLPRALDRMHEYGLCNRFLDYGTGKGKLLEYLKQNIKHPIQLEGYDPAVETFCQKPSEKFDIVTCLDVLEHIELDTIDNVLTEIRDYTRYFCYLVIDLQPAVKTLSDGRNAHILLAPPNWWQNKISQLFTSYSTFPIYHGSGDIQKIAIIASNDPKCLKLMHGFITKLNVFELSLVGGVLEKRRRILKKQ
ncbi:methyltransferase domain-containing protein [Synechococcus sp. MU1650]|uniref:methyltransferase domain-containing protein n=1 Tax=Synechococcus sp. MU1650 TaxID=2508352 RepID=UPI001CF81926|nr:methyltransferase domain-containing protein [Synechococcus sp. MU1650]MCB4378640.1 methyltransferase domain-containing protein [Synechococcus sp. MU1650]